MSYNNFQKDTMAKLIDVAEKAGVSITTASMALSGKGRISAEVRQKVLEAAEKAGYKKNRPSQNKNWTLLFNLDKENDSLSYFFNPLIRQLRDSARKAGYTVSLLPVTSQMKSGEIFRELSYLKTSALLSIHLADQTLFDRLEKSGIPCVIINNTAFLDHFFTVCVDDFQGAYEGTLKLIEAGHRKIAYLDYPRENLPGTLTDRYFGFRKAIEENGIILPEDWRRNVDILDYEEITSHLKELFTASASASSSVPTGIFLHDDLLAGKVAYLLEKMGYSIPGDISLIAPGDTLNYESPETCRISTMKIDTELMGSYAANMMLERLGTGQQAPHILKIKQTFIDRNSIYPPSER